MYDRTGIRISHALHQKSNTESHIFLEKFYLLRKLYLQLTLQDLIIYTDLSTNKSVLASEQSCIQSPRIPMSTDGHRMDLMQIEE